MRSFDGDPFGVAEIRGRVLAAWTASPARFREDANAEEDHALGGYRDRVVIELAQNAADAAARAGVPGRVRFALRDGVLTAANTGAPLDADGVAALSTLRASAKRDDVAATGRFGVGFAAVVAISDEPSITTASGEAVGWSAGRTREAVAAIPELADELARRGGRVPLLRLPYAGPPDPVPDGFATLVRLPLRDAEAERLARRLLTEAGPALLLALPALGAVEIDIEGEARTLTADWDRGAVRIDGATWHTAEAHGTADAALMTGRPVEERPHWQVRWAVADGGPPADVPDVVHAPTPSDEPLGLPALLIASFPLAPDRRHVAPGPLTDFLIERAAEAYVALLAALPAVPALLDLVPGPVAKGELDAKVRRAILDRLPDTPLLPAPPPPAGSDAPFDAASHERGGSEPARPGDRGEAARTQGRDGADLVVRPGDRGRPGLSAEVARGQGRDGADVVVRPGDRGETGLPAATRVRGRDAVAVDGPAALNAVLAEAVPGLLPSGWPARHPALGALGVRRAGLADVIDALAELNREPAWWRRLYAALEGADREALTGLPVPLADGRTVRGPRGLLITDPAGTEPLNLRVVHPEAAHPLLVRLGANEAGPRAVLADPATRGVVAASFDEEDPEPIWRAVLGLVARAGLRPGEEPWLAELALPADDGEIYPAGELLLPGSPLREVIAADAPFGVADPGLVERYGAATLEAVGVLRTFALVRAEDVIAPEFHLDGEEEWTAQFGDGFVVPEFTAVRDLELVAGWDRALSLLAEPPLRAAVVEPVRVVLADGRTVTAPSYTAWWLRRHPVLAGRRPGELALGDALTDLYDPAPAGLDPELGRALGVRTSLGDLLADPAELLARLGDPARTVSRERLRALWRALSAAELDVEPPDRVRAFVAGRPEVVPAEDAIVVDRPDLLPLLAGQPLLFVPAHVADALDLSLGSEEAPGEVTSAGAERPVPGEVHAVLPDAPRTYVHHDRLIVDGVEVPWWYGDDVPHASGPAGLARALAWACGRWPDRLLAEAVLTHPDALPFLLAEDDLG